MKGTKGERGTAKIPRLPEETQANMRRRLQMLRESMGIKRTQIRSMSDGTLQVYELQDISTMRLGHLWSLAAEYGYTFNDILQYIIGNDGSDLADEARVVRRVGTYLRLMSDETQELACDLLRKLVDFDAERGAGKHARGGAMTNPRRKNTNESAAKVTVLGDDG